MALALEKEVVSQLWRVRRTCAQMLRDRDFNISKEDLEMRFEDFSSQFASVGISGIRFVIDLEWGKCRSRLKLIAAKKSDSTDLIMVFYPEEEKVGVNTIKTYVGMRLILIMQIDSRNGI